jgi:hypothetical protein
VWDVTARLKSCPSRFDFEGLLKSDWLVLRLAGMSLSDSVQAGLRHFHLATRQMRMGMTM